MVLELQVVIHTEKCEDDLGCYISEPHLQGEQQMFVDFQHLCVSLLPNPKQCQGSAVVLVKLWFRKSHKPLHECVCFIAGVLGLHI